MTKSVLLAAGALVVTIGIVIGGVTLFRAIALPGGVSRPVVSPSVSPAPKPILAISAGNVISPSIDLSGNRVRFYDVQERKFKDADFSGTRSRTISEHEFHNVFRVNWAPTSTLAILEYENEFSDRQLSLVDLVTGTTTPLHENIRAVAWSPDGTEIAYQWRNDATGENAIFLSSPDTINRRSVLPIQLLSMHLFWVAPDSIVIAEQPSPGIPSLVLALNLQRETMNVILQDRFGVSVLPSPDGRKVLVSSTRDAQGGQLATEVYDLDGTLLAALPFTTLAEKCAWGSDSETLFCAIPASLTGASGLPFSYWTGVFSTRDAFAAYKFTTGELRELSKTLPDVDAIDLVIPRTEDAIAFVNRLDGRLTLLQP